MKPQFKTLSQQCSGYIGPIPGRNVKSNKRGFSFMKLLDFGFKLGAWEWGGALLWKLHISFCLDSGAQKPTNRFFLWPYSPNNH